MLEHLFSPLALGPVELRNRIVSTAHQTTLVHDHVPTDEFAAYHEARARGGVGLIVLEATADRELERRATGSSFDLELVADPGAGGADVTGALDEAIALAGNRS